MSRFSLLIVLVASACSPSVNATMFQPLPPVHREPAQMGMFMGKSVPSCDYEEVGQISVYPRLPGATGEDDDIMRVMRKAVADRYADGVLGLQKAAAGTVNQGAWEGRIYHCRVAAK